MDINPFCNTKWILTGNLVCIVFFRYYHLIDNDIVSFLNFISRVNKNCQILVLVHFSFDHIPISDEILPCWRVNFWNITIFCFWKKHVLLQRACTKELYPVQTYAFEGEMTNKMQLWFNWCLWIFCLNVFVVTFNQAT